MKKSDFGVVTVLYVLVGFFTFMTMDLPDEAQTYPLTLLAALFFLITLYLVIALRKFFRERVVHDDIAVSFAGFLPVQFFGVVLGCILYLVGLMLVGYYVASVIYLGVAMVALGVKKWVAGLSIVVLMAVIWSVFSLFLKVPLPAGILWS